MGHDLGVGQHQPKGALEADPGLQITSIQAMARGTLPRQQDPRRFEMGRDHGLQKIDHGRVVPDTLRIFQSPQVQDGLDFMTFFAQALESGFVGVPCRFRDHVRFRRGVVPGAYAPGRRRRS